ncbi:hypothetical protein M758_11G068000 [Ceratodon purpureus]|nr:hypothetical protein M758_11G068000 [Ceratodon purpureus]
MPGFLQLQIASKMRGTMEPVLSKFIISLVHDTLRLRVVRLSFSKLHQPRQKKPLNATFRTSQIFYHLPEYPKFIEQAWAHDHKTHPENEQPAKFHLHGGNPTVNLQTFNSTATCCHLKKL